MNKQKKKNLYIIAGCNGAGKTTASFTVLPEMLNCPEFVNADEIAKGLSPFHPESVAVQAGKLMIERMIQLLKDGETFALETTLSTRSYVKLVQQAQRNGYYVTLIFFSLASPEQAVRRVAQRVTQGGHNIPTDVIYRRYARGLKNLFQLYIQAVDYWVMYDNSDSPTKKIAYGWKDGHTTILEDETWNRFKKLYDTDEE
ncbi:MAG: zeta toxin family protein [Bacteroidaceae bacterium]|nr:zeta toxin family protein [Prevotellaceae bacterium]MDY5632896.1 zeta toxin family protein [Bacteroidaceae bacterium]